VPWGRLDDGLHDNPKFAAIHDPKHPTSVWLMVLSWALGQLGPTQRRPGHVPEVIAKRFGHRSAMAKLIDSGLWSLADGGGYDIHDFATYAMRDGARERSSEDPDDTTKPKDLSEKRAEAGRRGAAARWQVAIPADGKVAIEANGKLPMPHARAPAPARPDPDPDPDPEKRESTPPVCHPAEATPEPDPWGLSGGVAAGAPPTLPATPGAPSGRPSSPSASTGQPAAPAGPAVAKAPVAQERWETPAVVVPVRDALLRDAADLIGTVAPAELAATSARMVDAGDRSVRSSKSTVPLLVPDAVIHARRWKADHPTATPERVLAEIEAKTTWLLGDIDARKREPPKRAAPPTEEKWGGVTKY
jgi:hypothetical protein